MLMLSFLITVAVKINSKIYVLFFLNFTKCNFYVAHVTIPFFWLNSNCLSRARSVVSSVSFLLSVIVKELWKLVNICQSYGQKQSDTFFIWTWCRFGFVVRVKSITLVYSVYRTYLNLVVRLVICFSTCKNNSSKVAMSIRTEHTWSLRL